MKPRPEIDNISIIAAIEASFDSRSDDSIAGVVMSALLVTPSGLQRRLAFLAASAEVLARRFRRVSMLGGYVSIGDALRCCRPAVKLIVDTSS